MLSEKVIQKAVLDYLGTIPGIYFFRAAAGAVTTSTGRFFKTGKKGLPDIVCCVPKKTDNGRTVGVFIGLEIKTEKGRQSPAQKEAQKQIEEAGGHYYIIRSLKDVKEII
jgi:hypothetical protein